MPRRNEHLLKNGQIDIHRIISDGNKEIIENVMRLFTI